MDRALDSDSKGRWFESSQAYHTEKQHYLLRECCFLQHYVGMSCVDRQELNLTELLQREGKLDIVYLV